MPAKPGRCSWQGGLYQPGAIPARLVGAGLTLPLYGAEAFGLHAIGQEAAKQHGAILVDLTNDVRFGEAWLDVDRSLSK